MTIPSTTGRTGAQADTTELQAVTPQCPVTPRCHPGVVLPCVLFQGSCGSAPTEQILPGGSAIDRSWGRGCRTQGRTAMACNHRRSRQHTRRTAPSAGGAPWEGGRAAAAGRRSRRLGRLVRAGAGHRNKNCHQKKHTDMNRAPGGCRPRTGTRTGSSATRWCDLGNRVQEAQGAVRCFVRHRGSFPPASARQPHHRAKPTPMHPEAATMPLLRHRAGEGGAG